MSATIENKGTSQKKEMPPAVPAAGLSLGVAVVDTAVISAFTGFSLPAAACIGIGAGIFAVAFTVFACCHAAGKADEAMGYK